MSAERNRAQTLLSRSRNKKEDDQDDQDQEQEQEHELSAIADLKMDLSESEMTDIGRRAKRLLDVGRMEILKSLGFNARLVHYIDKETTPENCLLIATR